LTKLWMLRFSSTSSSASQSWWSVRFLSWRRMWRSLWWKDTNRWMINKAYSQRVLQFSLHFPARKFWSWKLGQGILSPSVLHGLCRQMNSQCECCLQRSRRLRLQHSWNIYKFVFFESSSNFLQLRNAMKKFIWRSPNPIWINQVKQRTTYDLLHNLLFTMH
jgi:hypothetical protein